MVWILLAAAIGSEVAATASLRAAVVGHRAWYVAVAIGYLLAFGLLSLVLADGLGLGIAYGIWSSCGVALTAVVGRVLFKEPLTWTMGAGIGLIAVGVLLIETGSG
jgi:small multidrug resistance pump